MLGRLNRHTPGSYKTVPQNSGICIINACGNLLELSGEACLLQEFSCHCILETFIGFRESAGQLIENPHRSRAKLPYQYNFVLGCKGNHADSRTFRLDIVALLHTCRQCEDDAFDGSSIFLEDNVSRYLLPVICVSAHGDYLTGTQVPGTRWTTPAERTRLVPIGLVGFAVNLNQLLWPTLEAESAEKPRYQANGHCLGTAGSWCTGEGPGDEGQADFAPHAPIPSLTACRGGPNLKARSSPMLVTVCTNLITHCLVSYWRVLPIVASVDRTSRN